ncbi:MAG: hypothetical protein QXM68_03470 [Candidatus Aenigmatarchaeota archaeon]|nr:hypothetical protein [Candidatus Aenigmarchaeota archaeon]
MIAILLLLLIINPVYAQVTVGVSPPVVDLKDVDRGEARIVKFNIITSTQSTLVVRLEPVRGKSEFFKDSSILANLSEEDTSSWTEFISNPVELQPSSIQGTSIKATKEVSFILNIPDDAEPGYHLFYVMLDPKGADSKKQISIKSVFPLTVTFNVPGNVQREIKIYDTKLSGTSPGTVYFETLMQNTGNVTVMIKKGVINVYDEYGDFVGSTNFPSFYMSPGEMKTVKTAWNTEVKLGQYMTQTIVDYSSNITEKNSTFSIYQKPVMPISKTIEKPKTNLWLLIIILLVIAIAYYWYKRD